MVMSEELVFEADKLNYIYDLIHRIDIMQRIEAALFLELGKPGCH